eukprot:160339-Prymnesium_polylepis.1
MRTRSGCAVSCRHSRVSRSTSSTVCIACESDSSFTSARTDASASLSMPILGARWARRPNRMTSMPMAISSATGTLSGA